MVLPSMRQEMFAQRVALMFDGAPAALVLNGVNAAVLAFAFADTVAFEPLMAWLLAFAVVMAGQALLYGLYRRRRPGADGIRSWVAAMTAAAGLNGVVWGAVPWVFGVPELEYQILSALILVVLVTGAVMALYPVWSVYLAFCVPVLVLLSSHALVMGTKLHLSMAALGSTLGIMLVYFAKRQNGELSAALGQHHKNVQLLNEVRHENDDLMQIETLLRQKTLVLDAVSKVQELFIAERAGDNLFSRSLEIFLELTRSTYGFIGEVCPDERAQRILKVHAVARAANGGQEGLVAEGKATADLELGQNDGLPGDVLRTGEVVVVNTSADDSWAGEVFSVFGGHASIEAFLGIPLYVGDEMIGMLGIANRAGGYPLDVVTALEPVISAMANMLAAVRSDRERLEAEFEASQAMERLTMAIETLNDGFVIFDRDDRLVLCNSKYKEMYAEAANAIVPGATFEEILRAGVEAGQYAEAEPGSDDAERWIQNSLAAHRRKASLREQKLADGTWLRIEERETPDGGRVGFRVDITEMKLAQERLRKSEEKFRSIVESTAEGYWMIDPDTKETLEVNDALCTMLGYTPDEMIGRRPTDFCDEANAAIFRQQMSRISATDHRSYEITLKHKDGHDVPTYFSATTLRSDHGEPANAFAFVSDMTEQKRIQKRLHKAVQEVEKASRAKSEFLSSMSHELRTPMNAVLGFAQLLQMNPQVPLHPKQEDAVEQILKAGNHLLDLINEILDLSRIESGRINLTFETFDPREVVEECLNYMEPLADKHGVSIDVDVPSAYAFAVDTDRTRFKQVLLNLLSNAVKYNTPGGRVSLSVRTTERGHIRFSVADTGPGIPQDKQEEIFEPFSRLGAESTEIEGTGIGLTISRKLTELMGGQLDFESTPGEGSTFWIDLPGHAHIENASAHPAETARKLPDLPSGGHTVLYVEDNPDNLRLMEDVVEMLDDIDLITAHTGELGLEMAEIHRPAVVLLDINLPGIDGIEVLRRLRARAETASIPVIAISADAMPADIRRGLDAGFDAYLTKPINLVEVVDHLRRAMSGQLGPAAKNPAG